MLDSVENFLMVSALVKWSSGEPLTQQDLERVIRLLKTRPLQTAQVDPATMSGLQMQLRDALRPYFEQPK